MYRIFKGILRTIWWLQDGRGFGELSEKGEGIKKHNSVPTPFLVVKLLVEWDYQFRKISWLCTPKLVISYFTLGFVLVLGLQLANIQMATSAKLHRGMGLNKLCSQAGRVQADNWVTFGSYLDLFVSRSPQLLIIIEHINTSLLL